MNDTIVAYMYVLAVVLFVLSLRWMSEVKTSQRGNWAAASGMVIAIAATLLAYQIQRTDLLIGGFVVGAIIGVPIALKLPMTAVPQRTAMSHAFGSLAVALVGVSEYYNDIPKIDTFTVAVLSAEMILGFLTFTGSCIAFAKLQGLISGKPLIYRGRIVVSLSTIAIAIGLGVYLVINPLQSNVVPIMAAFALLFGFLLVMAIGGADMPTVIAILNAYAGLSAAGLGFVLDNKVLIVAGSLDGSSGFILAVIMSQAMNRSFLNVLFGGVGATISKSEKEVTAQPARTVQSYTPEDVATVIENARTVVFVPGYGLAVSQAQHVVKELADMMQAKGIDVKYAIHPVAGRMPGHMNVLLAEAQVPYDQLWEMDRINPLFPETDVAIVVGANDVTNPAARTKPDSPLYGMPILDVDKARTVVFIKRSMSPGFSGVDNELFYLPNTMMVFGDAKKVLTDTVAAMKK
ncbi:MAG TPA: NAD(P)(+) transhydrogenase (Re/Si-specific) subunit beta [Nitrososphaerales archaeon]|nr:NAD(P)(+) transhydrogenase (Re/Si-specific) subunit beta [Nitrososphaerales archaeon]